MITPITLYQDMGSHHICKLPNGETAFLHSSALDYFGPDITRFTAVVVKNERRDYPKWYVKRLYSDAITADMVACAVEDLTVFQGQSELLDAAYHDGLCTKLMAFREGKPVDYDNMVWYVADHDRIFVEEYE